MKVGILVFDQVEVLDFAGPYEVLAGTRRGEERLFTVATVGEREHIICSGGLQVTPDYTYDNSPAFDILVVPGGPGTRVEESKLQNTYRYIARVAETAKHIAGVCTGTYLMAGAGLLDGMTVTTHHGRREALRQKYPNLNVVNEKVVDNGKIITSAGVSSGIDMSLHLVEKLYGREVAQKERETIEYGMHL